MTGILFDIQKFSIHDGPGIRTNVFFKGCPLSCLWCHNPESSRHTPELSYRADRCVGCGACAAACPAGCHTVTASGHVLDRAACTGCGACTKACPANALEMLGYEATVEEVMTEVLRDKPFYETSGGGMTVSGGEPFAQYPFLLALLKAAKAAGLNTAVETSGWATEEQIREAAPYIDTFLYDYKETDPEKHKAFTGVEPTRILKNLALLDTLGADVVLRCPLIPTCNDRPDHLTGIAATAEAHACIREIHIEPYHPLGKGKSVQIGKPYALDALTFPDDATVKGWMDAVAAHTAKPVKKA